MTNKQYQGLLGRIATIERDSEACTKFDIRKIQYLEDLIDKQAKGINTALDRIKLLEGRCDEIQKQLDQERQSRLYDATTARSGIQDTVDAAREKTS